MRNGELGMKNETSRFVIHSSFSVPRSSFFVPQKLIFVDLVVLLAGSGSDFFGAVFDGLVVEVGAAVARLGVL